MEETITFEFIRKVQIEEQSSSKLTKLPEDFYKRVSSYIQQKKKITETMEDRKIALEIKSVERLVEDIFNRRERKILNSALIAARTNIPPENLTEEERKFFESLVNLIKERRNKCLTSILSLEEETIGLVVFKEDFPEFIGIDEKTYGPFKKGDIVKLPEENVKVLIEKGIVEELKVSR
ncbi:MAG: hypothetical protein QXX38_00365 [Candidatus Aenigmatarchaeota archaeon]